MCECERKVKCECECRCECQSESTSDGLLRVQSLFNFDMWAVHKAFLQLIEDEQGPSGDVPYVDTNIVLYT